MPTWADSIRMALTGWRIRMGWSDPRPGDVFRSGDWTTEVRIIRWAGCDFPPYRDADPESPALCVTIHRGPEVQGGTLDLPTLRDLLAGYRLARRGEG